ncbi:DUF983 domain-containing protein [Chelatococcus reniformis]|nr:DUF983 domain-containing protein [Chelatococcus reniformis]
MTSHGRRSVWSAIKRGFAGRCPACGDGRLFGRFLKVNDHCPACGEAFHHHRADDLPPYLVIVIVGHIVGSGILAAETYSDWPAWLHMALWPTVTVVLSLLLLQPVKGAVVALQWANGMHGFGGVDEEALMADHDRAGKSD